MIQTTRNQLTAICRHRGYTLEQVQHCILSEEGSKITIDETHPAYPIRRKPGFVQPQTKTSLPLAATRGPGTEMKALLSRIGITSSPTCSCNKRAKIMDEKGCDWCAEHVDEIDGWLAEEAKKRKLPYLSLAGKALIHLAIRRARKKTADS